MSETISALWRFPVKSMRGEAVDTVDVTPAGIVGDRAYGMVDIATGKVVSAKNPKLWPDLFLCRASFVEPPLPGAPPPPARIELGDGTVTRTDAPDVNAVLSRFFGRDVRLITAAPEHYVIDEYRQDGSVADEPLGASAFEALGLPSAVPARALVDFYPVSVLATANLRHLSTLVPGCDWDVRRFRMNVVIETVDPEQSWIGTELAVGDQVRLGMAMRTERCVMVNLGLEELPYDNRVLKTLGRHNQLCLGVYGVATVGGTLRTGDPVRRKPAGRGVA
ncbi:MOSC domain-containing protein [Kibdelosporangium persicum]|uniref:Sulfurase n=1 Tax=Kibdelosporangium persicum TaxID=2698649 RepID=A0ABX2F6T1_9PSEU|nr:MOSC N-terminal beta barrel domain-containing protein [Kibdelosporangium persicum]NRN66967.1 Sulfurase [Kibdelosporangium persicum]